MYSTESRIYFITLLDNFLLSFLSRYALVLPYLSSGHGSCCGQYNQKRGLNEDC